MGLLGLFIMSSYAIPIFLISKNSYQLGILSVESLKWAFYAYSIFYLIFYLFKNSNIFHFNFFDPIKINIESPKVKQLAYFFLSFWVLNKFNLSYSSLYHVSIIGIYIYLGTFVVLINQKVRIGKFEKYFFYFILTYEFLIRIFDGLLVLIGLLTLFLVIIDLYSSRKIIKSIFMVCIFLLTFIIISPIKSNFREIAWYTEKEYNIIDRFNLISELYSGNILANETLNTKTDLEIEQSNFFWRYSYQASALSLVLEETPSKVPFWNGESYVLISKFIPRILWPDKPKEEMGYKFGTRYGIIDYTNTNTSMNTPMLTEMYFNFGFFGIVFGMVILSMVYILMNNYFNNNRTSFIGKVYCVAFLFPFVSQESNFSLVFGNVPLLILTILGISNLYVNKK